MRMRATITSVIAGALLVVALPGAAHAMNPADEVFHPVGDEPAQIVDDAAAVEDDSDTAIPAGPPASEDAADRRERELAFARGSRMANDLSGYQPSLYQGKWFMPGKEDVRRCIMNRESHANYRSSSGVFHGAYSMSAALARGATWMMQSEVRREMGDEGVAIVKALRKMTPNRWNRYWQDRAFWTIWRNGEGSNHWRGGAHSC